MPNPEESEHKLSGGRGRVEGRDPDTFTAAVSAAVNAANSPEGTLLKVDIYVESVGDPDVGAYKVIVTPI